jgi:hypothetical protein
VDYFLIDLFYRTFGDKFKKLTFGFFVIFKPAMGLNMLGPEVSEDGDIKIYANMAVLDNALGRNLNNGVLAPGRDHLMEQPLRLKSAEHGHFFIVDPFALCNLETDSRGPADFFTGGLKHLTKELDSGRFARGAGDADDDEFARRKTKNHNREFSEGPVVKRNYRLGNKFSQGSF